MTGALDDAVLDLYAIKPSRFTAERSRRATQARDAGDIATARAIGALRRPTTSAWLINQLVRGAHGATTAIQKLDRLGHDLRTAQAELDAASMRELTQERHQLVAELTRLADDVAAESGLTVSHSVRRELTDTLGAAVADGRAANAVLSGNLTRPLLHSGFGDIDVTEATATPGGRRPPTEPVGRAAHTGSAAAAQSFCPEAGHDRTAEPTVHKVDADEQTRQKAESRVRQARSAVEAQEESVRLREQVLRDVVDRRALLQRRLDELQAEVMSLRRELDTHDREVQRAEHALSRQRRQLKTAAQEWERLGSAHPSSATERLAGDLGSLPRAHGS